MTNIQRKPAIFLDRDGTIIEDRGCLATPDQVELLPGVGEALRLLQPFYRLVIITNQPWIGRGMLSVDDVARVNAEVVTRLADDGIEIAGSYVCPHPREMGCACIKPYPTLALQAAEEHGLDIAGSWTIGDHLHDVRLAESLGAKGGVFVLTGHGEHHRTEAIEAGMIIAVDLRAAAQFILTYTPGVKLGEPA